MREWIALNMTPGIGPRAAAKLLERFGSAEAGPLHEFAELEHLECQAKASGWAGVHSTSPDDPLG